MLDKEFKEFYEGLLPRYDKKVLQKKREILEWDIKSNLPGIMRDNGIGLLKEDIRVIDQGSYKYDTIIATDVIDRDVAVIIPLDINTYKDPRIIKKYLKNSIDSYDRRLTIKEPCVRVIYMKNDKEWLHLDLPMFAEFEGRQYLARGKSGQDEYAWEPAEPERLNNLIQDSLKTCDALRRVVRYLKRWRDVKYQNLQGGHKAPPSIGLTLLARAYFQEARFNGDKDDLTMLYHTMRYIAGLFHHNLDRRECDIELPLPVQPGTDVFSKMRKEHSQNIPIFYENLTKAIKELEAALKCESEHDAAVHVRAVLGDEFRIPPMKSDTRWDIDNTESSCA